MLRLTRASPQTASQAFQSTLTVHLAFVASIVVYVFVGEVMRWSDPEFAGRGYGPGWGGAHLIWLRLAVLAVTAINAAPLLLIYSRDRYREKIVEKSVKEPTIASSSVLAANHLVKLATATSVGVLGLLLYVLASERLDLYLFCGIALAGQLLAWPKRSVWESAFRRHAHTNPEIPADPWHAG